MELSSNGVLSETEAVSTTWISFEIGFGWGFSSGEGGLL